MNSAIKDPSELRTMLLHCGAALALNGSILALTAFGVTVAQQGFPPRKLFDHMSTGILFHLLPIAQFAYLGPWWNHAEKRGELAAARGIKLAVGLTFLSVGACWVGMSALW
jgi:hypothetical protein